MAKRFTDTAKWQKKFIRELPARYKLLWLYILDECDHTGIWHVEMDIATIRLGVTLDTNKALQLFGDKIIAFDNNTKWFIPSFIDFQYGELNPKNRVHWSVISELKKYNLLDFLEEVNKGLISPLEGAKDKYKDMEKEKEKKEKIAKKSKTCLMKNSGLTIEQVRDDFSKRPDLKNADPEFYFNQALDWSTSKSMMRSDWMATVRNFARGDIKDGKLKTGGEYSKYNFK